VLHETELYDPVRTAMPGADDDTIRIVAAITGLLGAVAYADGVFDPSEVAQVRAELERVNGLGSYGVGAIMQVLEGRLLQVATVDVVRSTRVLRDLADADLRREVLALLLRLAAADGSISTPEVTVLRHITSALGLSQDDYNQLQAQYRHLLEILKPPT
jgi:uncharacterized tellurite resistance protein B-like protein